jgi:hypothetical protein
MQPKSEFSASKSKEIQGKKLGFPWIPLAESGLFNGLQRKKIKNLPPLQLASWVVRTAASASRLARHPIVKAAHQKTRYRIFWISKIDCISPATAPTAKITIYA